METFKVGDWLRNTEENRVFKATKSDIHVIELLSKLNKPHYAEKWEPKDGEWVVVQNFLKKDCFEVIKYNNFFHSTIDCEPFVGELPIFIKGE